MNHWSSSFPSHLARSFIPRLFARGAKKKAGGSSRNGRDSAGRRLGVKVGDGESVRTGQILVRQRGTKWLPGFNVGVGRDHTIYALLTGCAAFRKTRQGRTSVSVLPAVATSVVSNAAPQ